VLLIGDSFMAALQVEHEQSLAGLMESELESVVGAPVAVWNGAVPAWDPPHYLIRAREVFAGPEPIDLVLVAVYLGNDIVDWKSDAFEARDPTPQPRARMPRRAAPAEWIDALARPLDNTLRQRSHLYVLARHGLTAIRMRAGLSTIYFPDEYLVQARNSARWDTTADILSGIAELANAREVPVLFVLIPPDFQVDPPLLHRHAAVFGIETSDIRIDQPNELLVGRLSDRGLTVLDPTPALRAAVAEGRRTHGSVDSHYTAHGHAVTWEFIRDEVVRHLEHDTSTHPSEIEKK
jgi:hypothetical protein